MSHSSLPVLFNKQPILSTQNTLLGFHLSLDVVGQKTLNEVQWQDAIAELNIEVEKSGGFDNLTKGLRTFYSAPIETLKLSSLPNFSHDHLWIEVQSSVIENKTYLTNLKEILGQGIRLSIQDYQGSEKDKKLLSIAHTVKISSQAHSLDNIKALTEALPSNTEVILTHVDNEELREKLLAAGFTQFEGHFFTEPVIAIQSKPLEGSRLALVKLLASLNNPNITFEEVVSLIKTDAVLSYKLLSAINHPSNDLPHFIDNLKEAVSFMGLKRLKFWVNMIMMSQVDDVPKELLATALIRAKFLEAVALHTGHQIDSERFFMVGLFSTLNAFLKVPMVDIVDKLPITDEIKIALTQQKGSMGKALFIVRALEQGNTQFIMMGHEGMNIMEISSSYMKASGWANQTLSAL